MRLTLQRRQVDMRRMRMALETLSNVNDHDKFAGAAMAVVNEVTARWQADGAALGMLKGRYVHLKALSHTEKISRKMKLVQDLEAVMEECLDQDVEIVYPAGEEATYVSRSAAELSRAHGPMTVLSVPLRRVGEVVGVLTVHRSADRPFTLEEIESLRLVCDLMTARLASLHESDRWFGARAAGAVKRGAAYAVGPKHTWVKLLGAGVAALLLFAIFARGDYHAEGEFAIEPRVKQVIDAPWDGTLREVHVRQGDSVVAGETILATLDTRQLADRLAQVAAERNAALKEKSSAMAQGKLAEAQAAQARADKAAAQVAEIERRIQEAEITSRISGVVISRDLDRVLNKRVERGEPLFEVAPVQNVMADLSVPEDQIADVVAAFEAAQAAGEELTGELATEASPGRHILFLVERVNPVAEVEDDKNVFKVRARLTQVPEGMILIPDMEGVAKIDLGERRYAELWTRKLINWVRMKLWI
jgi:biotin carboxyl carrier protein